MSSIEQDILEWLQGRPAWQRNLLQRIVRNETIDDAYISSVAQSVVEGNHELELPELTASELPISTAGSASLNLLSLGQLKSVNALLGDQTLTFSPVGVTVVYGDNGSGKSGYARLLKNLVGARHQEDILSDAFLGSTGDQSAQVSYSIDNVAVTEQWPGLTEALLNQAHFYDEACGDDYLARDTELAYRPLVLSLLDELIKHTDSVRSVISGTIQANEVEALKHPAVVSGTRADLFLEKLSASTTQQMIDEALSLPDDAEVVHADLVQEQARLKATDPEKEWRRLLSASASIETLASHFETISAKLSAKRGAQLITMLQNAKDLRKAADAASNTSFADEPLDGVGSETWRVMWEAAEKYSVSEAYPQVDFPAVDQGRHCVLCQQPLQTDAQERLRRFHWFVHDDVATRASAAETEFKDAIQELKELSVSSESIEASLGLLASVDDVLATAARTAVATAKRAKTRIIERLRSETDEPWIPLEEIDVATLRVHSADLEAKATAIDGTVFAQSLTDCKSRLDELEGTMAIAAVRPALEREVSRLEDHKRLKKAFSATTTQPISLKSGVLATTYVTEAVKKRFIVESKQLKLEHVELGDKGSSKGQVRQRPALLGVSGGSPKAVLSEGEQTAAGLAGFFTEVEFDDSKSAVVLDDPMSSLDHERRERAARRIVEIAQNRQVIVFTHDLMFLGEVVKISEELGVEVFERAIERNGSGRPGRVIEGHPWKAKDARKRIGDLDAGLARIAKGQSEMSSEDYERSCADWAGKLSETWERIVRSEVAFKLVDRGTTEVRPKMFRIAAQVTEADNAEFQTGYGVTSKWARRHDKSEEVNFVTPTIEEMRAELDRIRSWRDKVSKYENS